MSESQFTARHIRKRVGRNVFDSPPRISVIITAHNDPAHIRETLDSVVKQKFREHEIIVVNDGTGASEMFEREMRMRIEDVIYIKQREAGIGAARNTGIEHARGDFIAFLRSGDIWDEDFLASQYIFLQRNNFDLVYCDAAIFASHSAYRRRFTDQYPSIGEVNFASLVERRCNVLTSGTLFRKQILMRSGAFETGDMAKPSFHLCLRMAKAGAIIGYQEKVLVRLRASHPSDHDDPVARAEGEKVVIERVRDTIDLSSAELSLVDRRIAELEMQIALEQGRTFLKSGDYTDALSAFRVANHLQPSFRLKAMTWLTRLAPKTALRLATPPNKTNTHWIGR